MTAPPFRQFIRDASTFGGATIAVAVLGILQVFLVPRLLDVESFGFFRIFLLYGAYIGLLHFGLADGALLSWAGRPLAQVASEWRLLNRRMLAIQGAVATLALVAALLVPRPAESHIVAALGIAALLGNVTALAIFALQGAGDFRWAAAVVVAPPALFLATLLVVPPAWRSLDAALAAWLAGQAAATAIGLVRMWTSARSSVVSHPPALRRLFGIGTPTLAANFAGGLAQSIDRIILSWAIPVTQFALYGFAASALFAANAATQGLTRVTLPHAARLDPARRRQFFERIQDLILSGYGIGLVAYPAFEAVVRVWLPSYVSALPLTRALAVGTLFWTAGQIVQTNAFRVAERYGWQLVASLVGVVLVGIATGATLLLSLPLWAVAGAASAGMTLGWVVGAAILGQVSPAQAPRGEARFLVIGLAQAGAVIVATVWWQSLVPATLTYLILGAAPTLLALRWLRAEGRMAASPVALT